MILEHQILLFLNLDGKQYLTTNTTTGSYNIPASDISSLTPGNVNSRLNYVLEVTNLDGIVSNRSIYYRLLNNHLLG